MESEQKNITEQVMALLAEALQIESERDHYPCAHRDWNDNAQRTGQKGRTSCRGHGLDVHFKPRDEHQEEDTKSGYAPDHFVKMAFVRHED